MALDVGYRHTAAERAYDWLRQMQRPDGCWHAYYVGRAVKDAALDTNVTRLHRERRLAPLPGHGRHGVPRGVLAGGRDAIDFALRPAGRDRRSGLARRPAGRRRAPHGLVELSTPACAARLRVAERLGHERPDWELAPVASPRRRPYPRRVRPKPAWPWTGTTPSSGALLGAGRRRPVAAFWDTFVVEGRGVRCVSTGPVGDRRGDRRVRHGARRVRGDTKARQLFGWAQFLRLPTAAATGPAPTSTTSASTPTASCSRSSSRAGTWPRSPSPPTPSAGPGRRPACSCGRGCPPGWPPTS